MPIATTVLIPRQGHFPTGKPVLGAGRVQPVPRIHGSTARRPRPHRLRDSRAEEGHPEADFGPKRDEKPVQRKHFEAHCGVPRFRD